MNARPDDPQPAGLLTTPPGGEADRVDVAGRTRTGWSRLAGYLALGSVLAAGAWLRLDGLPAQSLTNDESFSWKLTRFPWSEVIARTAADVHPPLYYLALKGWTSLVGDSVRAMRGLSVLFDLTALALLYGFAADLARSPNGGGRRLPPVVPVGLLAAAFMALNPLEVVEARQARMYAQGVMLAVASSWALWRGLREPGVRPWAWAVYAVTAAALVYTHNFGLFTVAAQAVFAAGRTARRGGAVRWAAAGGFLAVALAYAPWAPVLLRQRDQVAEVYWTPPLLPHYLAGAIEQLFRSDLDVVLPAAGVLAPLAAAAVLAALLIRQRPPDVYVVLLAATPFALGVLVSVAQERNIVIGRCLAFSLPFLLIAAAEVVSVLPGRESPPATAAVLLVGLMAIQKDSWARSGLPSRPGIRGAAEVIGNGYRPGDLVVAIRFAGDKNTLEYYAHGRFRPMFLIPDQDPPLRHYNSRAVLDPGEVLRGSQIAAYPATRAWLLVTDSSRTRGPFLRGWSLVRSDAIEEAAPERGERVYVDLWERRREPASGDESRPS
jgi:mannosyltransferase